jgi:hypothetical protein
MSLASFQSETPRYVGEPDQSGTPLDSRLVSLFIGPIVLFPFEERSLKGTRRVQCRQRPLSLPIKRAFIHSERQDRRRQTMQSRSPTLCIRRAVATTSRQPVSRQACRRRYHVPSFGLQEPARTGRGWRAATIASRAISTTFDSTTAHLRLSLLLPMLRAPAWHVARSPTFTWPGIGSTSIPRLGRINWNKEQEEV